MDLSAASLPSVLAQKTPPPMPITAEKDLSALLHAIPYARTIGMRAELAGDEMTAILPFQDLLIGNPLLPALHGGVVGAFLEITAVCQLYIAQGQERFPKAIDITIDYLHSGRPRDTYARAIIVKWGRRIANVTAEAWQESRDKPIAAFRGHFLVTPREENGGT